MVDLEHFAEAQGYTIFFLTGRPIAQHDGTVANLTNAGYDVSDANLYLKDHVDAVAVARARRRARPTSTSR